MSKLVNKEYIVSIDRIESLVRVKLNNIVQPLNFKFEAIEHAISFVIAIVSSTGFVDLDEMCNDIKSSQSVVRTAENASTGKSKTKPKAKTTKAKATPIKLKRQNKK